MARAFVKIAKENGNLQERKIRFDPKKGSGSFSGKIQIITNNKGTISAIIPFTKIVGTTTTPSASISLSATSTHDSTISFGFNPDVGPVTGDISNDRYSPVCDHNLLRAAGFEIGNTIENSIYGMYKQIMAIPLDPSRKKYAPKLGVTSLKITTDFIVLQKVEGGLVTKFVFAPPPTLDSTTPSLNADSGRTGTYSLSLNIPLRTPDPDSGKRIISCKSIAGSGKLCVEEPFTSERYDELNETVTELGEISVNVLSAQGNFLNESLSPEERGEFENALNELLQNRNDTIRGFDPKPATDEL